MQNDVRSHSPLPWKAIKNNPACVSAFDIWDADGVLVAYLGHCRKAGQSEANANLIIAASGLLSACESVLHQLEHGEASEGDQRDIEWCARTLREAVAKAKGCAA